MRENRVAFIAAVNDEQYFEECSYYISRLKVPCGYEVEVIGVRQAESMCAAYNLGMQSTEAKYKVYLHQDVFIRNEKFIERILDIFQSDSEIGMIGMAGCIGMQKTGVPVWNAAGAVDCREPDMAYRLICAREETQDMYVEAVDGLLIATQYDIPWRKDLCRYFHFYDISQSFEMRRRGYRIFVPHQEIPWTVHACGFANMAHYEEGRGACLKEYPEFFYADGGFELDYDAEWDLLSAQLAKQIESLMEQGEWKYAADVIEQYRKGKRKDSDLERLGIMSDIKRQEEKAGVLKQFFDGLGSYSQMHEKYMRIRFLFFRMELGLPESEFKELVCAVTDGSLSCEAAVLFVLHAVADRKYVLEKIKKLYQNAGEKRKEEYISKFYEAVREKPVPVAYTKIPSERRIEIG